MISKKFVEEGVISKAYLSEDGYIFLVGKYPYSYKELYRTKKYMNLLESKIKSVKIPEKVKLIKCCEEYKYGALVYKYIEGQQIGDKIDKVDKVVVAKTILEFLNELHNLDFGWSEDSFINEEKRNFNRNLKLLKNYFSNEEILYIKNYSKEYFCLLENSEYVMIHGDLFEDNIIIDENGFVVGIIDFSDMAYAPIEFEFVALRKLDKEIFENILKEYKYFIDINKVKLIDLFTTINFFEYTQFWDEKGKLDIIYELRSKGLFNKLYNFSCSYVSLNEIDKVMILYKNIIENRYTTWNEYYPNKEIILEDINDSNLICVKSNEELIGIVCIGKEWNEDVNVWNTRFNNPGTFMRIGVHSKFKGKGVGDILLNYVLNELKIRGFDGVRILVDSNNFNALKLYNRFNFKFFQKEEHFDFVWDCMELKF